jgi:putative ubiquitin-RnfH superfamily antitoxin RatB of RatAB toxin-antitoxin module
MISVEVVFALPEIQVLESVELHDGASVQDAIDASGLPERFPEERLDALPTGIWGHLAEREQRLNNGDRVEIYRPLVMDPREARRQRFGASS